MKIFISIFFSIFCISVSIAKVYQPGRVVQYNGKAASTPLSGVRLQIRHALSTVSDKNGNFKLQFNEAPQNNRISVREIYKEGYEIYNTGELAQWNLNSKLPFIIKMCKSSALRKQKEQYINNSIEYYKAELKKTKRELKKLQDENKIADQEYNRKIREAEEKYEKQLDRLENYIDRFVRIDLTKLSAEEQEIIDLVEKGKIEEAIRRYDDMKLMSSFRTQSNNIYRIEESIDELNRLKEEETFSRDSVLSMILRQIDTQILAGGSENLEKARSNMCEIADTLSGDAQLQFRAATFLYDFFPQLKTAETYCKRALDGETDPLFKADIMYLMANIKRDMGDNTEAEKYYYEALKCWYSAFHNGESLQGEDLSLESDNYFNYIFYASDGLTEEIVDSYEISAKIFKCYEDIQTLYGRMFNDGEASLQISMAALNTKPKDPRLPQYLTGYYETPYGEYYNSEDEDATSDYLLNYLRWLDEQNIPFANKKRAEIYIELGNYNAIYNPENSDGIESYNKAIQIFTDLYGRDHYKTLDCWILIAEAYNYRGDHNAVIKTLQKNVIPYSNTAFYPGDISLFNLNYLMGEAYYSMKQWKNALDMFNNSLEVAETWKGTDQVQRGLVLMKVGICNFNLGQENEAKIALSQSKKIFEEIEDAMDYSGELDEISSYLDSLKN